MADSNDSNEHSLGDSNSYEGNILDLERIKRDFPSVHDMNKIGRAESKHADIIVSSAPGVLAEPKNASEPSVPDVLGRSVPMDAFEKEQSLLVTGHGTHIHDPNSEIGIFQSTIASPKTGLLSQTLRPRKKNATNNNLSPGRIAQRIRHKHRYGPYEPSTSNTDSDPLTPSKCSYAKCSFVCDPTRQDNMNRHIDEVHKRQYKWRCPVCSKGCRRDNGENHIADGHRIKDKCPICKVAFDVKRMAVHLEDPNSTCIQAILHLSRQFPEDQRPKFVMPHDYNANNSQ